MIKYIAIALAVLLILPGIAIYNMWYADHEPVTKAPGALEEGRTALHDQLWQAEQREAQFEKQDWDSTDQIRVLINSHEQRIEQLAGNNEAGEIVAHDRDAIARLEKRIADLEAQHLAQAAEPEDHPQQTLPPQPDQKH